ncbi:MAG TPA: hypothetical protein DCM45_07070 [Clostridiales bacterium]|nr:hypothetical protein [Clostridiales bacterium]
MTERISQPDFLLIRDCDSDNKTFGCNQAWYAERWQRDAGCGPCTAATILYYLSRSCEGLGHLYTADTFFRNDFSLFMAEIWHFVTPGHMGVNEAAVLADGVVRYAAGHGVILRSAIKKVPPKRNRTVPYADFVNFIRQGLSNDCPVAFLNLSNGRLPNLDSWHWVTITELTNDGSAEISDSGERKQIDLQRWYGSSLLGGAAVWFTVDDGSSVSLVEDLGQR